MTLLHRLAHPKKGFVFILGVVLLMMAEGAGTEMRHALGMAVFAGMLGVTLFSVLLTPVFYEVLHRFGQQPAAVPALATTAAVPRLPADGAWQTSVRQMEAVLASLQLSPLDEEVRRRVMEELERALRKLRERPHQGQ